jgi:hypothetical protein
MNFQDEMLVELDAIYLEKVKACKTKDDKLEVIRQKFMVGEAIHKIMERLEGEVS